MVFTSALSLGRVSSPIYVNIPTAPGGKRGSLSKTLLGPRPCLYGLSFQSRQINHCETN